jgi:hypothetical protein
MKLTISVGQYRGLQAVKVQAVINRSKKTRRHQKTWTLKTVAPSFTAGDIKQSAEAEAKRWEQKVLLRYQQPAE